MPDSSTPIYVWIGAAIIVAVGLFVFGLSDVLRFSITRAWAIGGVCFRESIRRRVLWIIPLAAIGVVIVSQLQKAVDERDVIRETTKFCLFATGMVLVLTSIILACTNLPREIESRVIYTVVTKPATRLELVFGKIIGFCRVSALIVIIMGLFTYGYLEIRNWRQGQAVYARLQTDPTLGPAERNRLEHFHDAGLLTAESYARPISMQMMANLPAPGDTRRAIYGQGDQELLFPFRMNQAELFADPANPDGFGPLGGIGKTGMLIGLRVRWERFLPDYVDLTGHKRPAMKPAISVDIFGQDRYPLIGGQVTYDPRYPGAKLAHSLSLDLPDKNVLSNGSISTADVIWTYVPSQQCGLLYNQSGFFVHVTGLPKEYRYYVDASSAFIAISPEIDPGTYAPPLAAAEAIPTDQRFTPFAAPIARGRSNTRGGEELIGKKPNDAYQDYAILRFRAADVPVSTGDVPMEIVTSVSHTADADENSDLPTDATLSVLAAGATKPQTAAEVKLESQQTIYTSVPASTIGSGDFDLVVRCNTPGNVLAMTPDSIVLVVGEQPFAWNLIKALFIIWLLTVLVVTIAIMTSTFLSWPIAVVLTAVLLMGHWCVTQVADTADSTLGRSIATDMGLTDPSKAEAVVGSVNALSTGLLALGKILPDIDRFAAIDDIQRGAIVSAQTVMDSLTVLLCFGLPMAVVAYLVVKWKEVAP